MPDGSGGPGEAGPLVRVRFVQPDGRGIVPRKWSVDKGGGPLVFAGERVQKRLIQHGWPVELERLRPTRDQGARVRLRLLSGAETPEFLAAVQLAVQIEAKLWRADLRAEGSRVWLQGPHWLKLRRAYANGKVSVVGTLKRGPLPPPF